METPSGGCLWAGDRGGGGGGYVLLASRMIKQALIDLERCKGGVFYSAGRFFSSGDFRDYCEMIEEDEEAVLEEARRRIENNRYGMVWHV